METLSCHSNESTLVTIIKNIIHVEADVMNIYAKVQLHPPCCKFQKNLFEVWFYTFFSWILYMYIALRQGQTAPRGQSFDFNRNVLSLHSFVASFKKCLWSLILNNFFHDWIHVYSPGAGVDSPLGTNFDVNRKALSLYPFVASFKEISLKSDFIQFFSWFNTYR